MTQTPHGPDERTAPRLTARGRHFSNGVARSRHGLWIALCCVSLLLVVVGAGGVAALRLQQNVSTEALNLGGSSSGGAGDAVDGPLNILVIGSDTRGGQNSDYGDALDQESGARSDVMMLMQISEDRQNVNVVSFPRDLMVSIPECTNPESGTVFPAADDVQINESLDHGGPGCTVATINELTGVDIDHFMLVDFNAVKELSSVVGGVQVCVTEAIDDEYSGLDIPAGSSTVEGEQALAFLRSRHGFGDGSDIGRIQAQQGFMASLMRKVKAEGTLSNPGKLYDIAEAITQNVTVDEGFADPGTFVGIGRELAGIDLNRVVFATAPTEPYLYDANKLQLSADADQVFATMRSGGSLADGGQEPEESAAPTPSATAPEEQPDRSTPISVLNASGETGRADDVADLVESMGYLTVAAQEAGVEYPGSAVYYSTGYEAEAQEVAEKFGIPAAQVQPDEGYLGVALYVGQDFTEGERIEQQDSGEDQGIVGGASGQTADQETCQQAFAY